jgi:nucleoside 2-deoxyribosyltransferase
MNSKEHSIIIFQNNINKIKDCDIIVANINPFRGACVDDGTAFEIGFGYALGKKIYGYAFSCDMSLVDRTNLYYNVNDDTKFPIIENFKGNSHNLMIQESIELSGGKIYQTFDDVLKNI